MGKSRSKPTLPPVVVVVRQGTPSVAAAASWAALWSKILGPMNEKPAGETAGGDGGETDGKQTPTKE